MALSIIYNLNQPMSRIAQKVANSSLPIFYQISLDYALNVSK